MNKKFIVGLVLLLLLVPFASATLDDAILYYSFDDADLSGSNPLDLSSSSNDGTNNGATTGVTGAVGEAFDFDGSADYVVPNSGDTPFDFAYDDSFSYCAFVNLDTLTAEYAILSKQDYNFPYSGTHFSFRTTGELRGFRWESTGARYTIETSNLYPSKGVWEHKCFIYDAGTSTGYIYINGSSVGTTLIHNTLGSGNILNNEDLWIGRRTGSGADYTQSLDGKIDELAIYDRALSSAEVSDLYELYTVDGLNPYSGASGLTGADEFFIQNATSIYLLNDTFYNRTGAIEDSYGTNNGTGYGKTFYHGEVDGATWDNTSRINASFGGYYDFDGTDDYIDTGFDVDDNTEQITFSAWVYPTADDSNYKGIVADAFSTRMYLRSKTFYFVITNDAPSDAGATYTFTDLNEWYHLAGTYDGSNVKLYVNGVLEDTTAQTGSVRNRTEAVFIGSRRASDWYFNGSIDEVRIWERALNQSEIQQEMNSNAPYNSDGIVAYYGFNDNINTTFTPDQNHLTQGYRQHFYETGSPNFNYEPVTYFDGTDDYVSSGDVLDFPNTNVSFSAWIKPKKLSGEQGIIGKDDNTLGRSYFFETNGNKLRLQIGGTGMGQSTTSLNVDEWAHVVVVHDYTNSNVSYYINGAYDSSATNTKNISGSSADFTIGARTYSGSEDYFNGSIGDVRIYNKSLNANEVLTLYYGTVAEYFTAIENSTGNAISNFNATFDTQTQETTNGTAILYMPFGSNTVLFESSAYYDATQDITVTAPLESFMFSAANAFLSVNATNILNDAVISNFTINVTNPDYANYSSSENTTNGTTIIPYLSPGEYNVTIDAPGYAIYSALLNITSGQNNYTFEMYTTNSILFRIYDEVTGDLLNGTNMTVEVIGNTAQVFTTTNGSYYIDLLNPYEYEVRYYSTGNNTAYRLRSTWVEVDARTSQVVNLYALNESDPTISTATITFNVFSQSLDDVEGARVIVSRYYVENNSFIDIWARETNSQGQAIGLFESIDAFYKYRVLYDGDLKFTSSANGEQFLADDSIDIFINIQANIYEQYESIDGIPTSLTYTESTNTTGYFTYTFSSSTAVTGCIQVESFIGSTTQRNQTCVESTGGTLYFNVNAPNGGTFIAKGLIALNGDGFVVTDSLVYSIDSSLSIESNSNWQLTAAFIAILVTILAILLYVNSYPRLGLLIQGATFLAITVLPVRLLPVSQSNAITAGVGFFCLILIGVYTLKK